MLSKRLWDSMTRFSSRPCIDSARYLDILELSRDWTQNFKNLGLRPGGRVLVQTAKSPLWVSQMMATWNCGGIFVPVPPLDPFIAQKIQQTKPTLLIGVSGVNGLERIDGQPCNPVRADIATILYTSGSAGNPKGTVLSHQNIESNLVMIENLYGQEITHNDRSFSILPWHHCYGLVCELLYLLSRGASIRLPESKNPLHMMKELRQSRPTLLFTVPKMLERISKSHIMYLPSKTLIRYLLWGPQMRMMSVGGGPCPKETIDFFHYGLDIPVYQGYGMTELSPMISLNSPTKNKTGSVGIPLEGVPLRIEDAEIQVGGPCLTPGYLDRITEKGSLLTKLDLIEDKWFPTGDTGFLDENGNLFITGRKKFEYKLTNGKYVNPVFLESCISTAQNVEQVVVMPSENHQYNIAIVGFRKPPRNTQDAVQQIKKALESRAESYEIPRKVYILQQPFTTDNGLLSQKLEPMREKIRLLFLEKKLILEY
jgi:long-chain acyl-CoA synthetase